MTAARPAPHVPTLRPRAKGCPAYLVSFMCGDESVPAARMALRTTLDCWGLADFEDFAQRAAVVVSELATNAVVHSARHQDPDNREMFRLTIERPGPGTVRVVVSDRSGRCPVRKLPTGDDETGRGLLLVGAMASDWGVTPRRGGGKEVWAVLAVDL